MGIGETVKDKSKTALVVIDVQNGVVAGAHERDAVVRNVARLVVRARETGVPVVWVQHSDDELVRDSDEWRLVPELEPVTGEPTVHKTYGDSFEGTNLESLLSDRGVGRLVVAGAQTDFCIRSTLHGALARGYDAVLVEDAHTTNDCETGDVVVTAAQIIAHTNFYWHWQRTEHGAGGTVPTDDAL